MVELKLGPRVPSPSPSCSSVSSVRHPAVSSPQEDPFCGNNEKDQKIFQDLTESHSKAKKKKNCRQCNGGDFPWNFLGLTVTHERMTSIAQWQEQLLWKKKKSLILCWLLKKELCY
jgi:hypothetical protein